MQFFPGMSLAVTTTNSSQLIPGPNLIFLIFPRGMRLRTVAPYSMLGSEISSMYRARPVTLSRPSFRGADTPIVAGPGMVRSCYCDRKPPTIERFSCSFSATSTPRPYNEVLRSEFSSRRLAWKCAFGVDGFATQIGGLHDSSQPFAHVGRNGMPVVQSLRGHHEFRLRIKHDEVRVVPGGQLSFARIASRQFRGPFGHPSRDIAERKFPGAGFGPHQRQR